MRVSVACFLVPKHLSPWGFRSVFPGVEGEDKGVGGGGVTCSIIRMTMSLKLTRCGLRVRADKVGK
jgi:hypothetical protein